MMETGYCEYGGQEVPQSAICKLKNRKSSGVIQSESQDLRTGGHCISPGEPGAWMSEGRKR